MLVVDNVRRRVGTEIISLRGPREEGKEVKCSKISVPPNERTWTRETQLSNIASEILPKRAGSYSKVTSPSHVVVFPGIVAASSIDRSRDRT